jgi:hypothetical protein
LSNAAHDKQTILPLGLDLEVRAFLGPLLLGVFTRQGFEPMTAYGRKAVHTMLDAKVGF